MVGSSTDAARRRSCTLAATAGLALLLLLAGPAPARAGGPSDESLTLSDFVASVEAESPQLDAARLRTKAARQRVGPARALPDPFIAIGIDELALGREDEADGMRVHPRPVLRYQVNQTFPLPPERNARRDAAAATAEAVGGNVEVTRRTLRVAAVQLFLRARYVEAALRTNAQLGEALDDVIASAEARYITGGTAHHDVLLAKAERALLQRDALVLRRTLAVLHAEMNELRGRPADEEVPPLLDDEPQADRPLSLGAALAQQPELHRASAAVTAADARVEVARTAGHPDLSLQVMAMQSLTPGMPSNAGAMVGVTVPIYWKRKQAPVIDAAKVERDATVREKDALQRRLEAEWVAAERAYETSVDTVRLYERDVLPATRAALESSKAAYATQQVPFVELLGVLRASLAVELELVAAQTDVRLARLRLEELLAMPSVVRLAPGAPTLFGGMGGMSGGASGGMGGDAMAPARPIQMGSGMQPPAALDVGGSDDSGMGGM